MFIKFSDKTSPIDINDNNDHICNTCKGKIVIISGNKICDCCSNISGTMKKAYDLASKSANTYITNKDE